MLHHVLVEETQQVWRLLPLLPAVMRFLRVVRLSFHKLLLGGSFFRSGPTAGAATFSPFLLPSLPILVVEVGGAELMMAHWLLLNLLDFLVRHRLSQDSRVHGHLAQRLSAPQLYAAWHAELVQGKVEGSLLVGKLGGRVGVVVVLFYHLVERAFLVPLSRAIQKTAGVHTEEHTRGDALELHLTGVHRRPLQDGKLAVVLIGSRHVAVSRYLEVTVLDVHSYFPRRSGDVREVSASLAPGNSIRFLGGQGRGR